MEIAFCEKLTGAGISVEYFFYNIDSLSSTSLILRSKSHIDTKDNNKNVRALALHKTLLQNLLASFTIVHFISTCILSFKPRQCLRRKSLMSSLFVYNSKYCIIVVLLPIFQ